VADEPTGAGRSPAVRRPGLGAAIMLQFSDLPWLVVAGLLGLLAEVGANLLHAHRFTSGWAWLATIVLFDGLALGFASFRLNRSWRGFLVAGLAALGYLAVDRWLIHLVAWPAGGAGITARVGWLALAAVLPYLSDAIVDPWLLRIPPVARLAAYHPRYAHLDHEGGRG
jgi:hypothetical protein